MKSYSALRVLVFLTCLVPAISFATTWYFTVTLKDSDGHEYFRFKHSQDSEHDVFTLLEDLSSQPLDFHNPDTFADYLGNVIPVLGFDPITEAVTGTVSQKLQQSELDAKLFRELYPYRIMPNLINVGEHLDRQFQLLTGISLADWNPADHVQMTEIVYGSRKIIWPMPTNTEVPFSDINMHRFIQHVLYEQVLTKAGFAIPPCFSGLINRIKANLHACHSLFYDDPVAGMNWLHGADIHLLQIYHLLLSGASAKDIRFLITERLWDQMVDKPSQSFDGMEVEIQVYKGWNLIPAVYSLSTNTTPILNKPAVLNHHLLLGSWSRAMEHAATHHTDQARQLFTHTALGTSSVDGPLSHVPALKALENAWLIAFLQDIADYRNMVFAEQFPEELKRGLQTIENRKSKNSPTPYNVALGFSTRLSLLHSEWEANGQLISLDLQNRLLTATTSVMYFELYFPELASIPLINARHRLLVSQHAQILESDERFIIYHPTELTPQQQAYQKKLQSFLESQNLHLGYTCSDGNCLFLALAKLFDLDADDLRTRLVAFLKKLRSNIQSNRTMSALEFAVWSQNGHDFDWLKREINLLEHGGWGGASNLGALVGIINSQNHGMAELNVILPYGPELMIWHIHPTGYINEVHELASGQNILVQNGLHHWTLAETNQAAPQPDSTDTENSTPLSNDTNNSSWPDSVPTPILIPSTPSASSRWFPNTLQ